MDGVLPVWKFEWPWKRRVLKDMKLSYIVVSKGFTVVGAVLPFYCESGSLWYEQYYPLIFDFGSLWQEQCNHFMVNCGWSSVTS
jgi:hypothetical protein